jgi:hypothetical protein
MPQYGRRGDVPTIAYITGPKHVFLGMKLAKDPVVAPAVVKHAPRGDCRHGTIDEARVLAAVVAGAGEYGFHPTHVEFIENDSPDYALHEKCARLLAQRALADEA